MSLQGKSKNNTQVKNIPTREIENNSINRASQLQGSFFCLPSKAGKPARLKEIGVAPIKGKSIRLASASWVTVRCEGSDRK